MHVYVTRFDDRGLCFEAKAFSGKKGIILTLRAVVTGDLSEIPKFLRVSWLSAFPHEDELLFYGENIEFAMVGITEADTNAKHKQELVMLTLFQRMVQNEATDGQSEWAVDEAALAQKALAKKERTGEDSFDAEAYKQRLRKKEQKALSDMVRALCILIQNHSSSNRFITPYGKQLFQGFCRHEKRTWITIKDYKTLPLELGQALFGQDFPDKISLEHLMKLFPNMRDVSLSDLKRQQMDKDRHQYVAILLDHIKQYNRGGRALKNILFQASTQKIKEDVVLKELATQKAREFKKYGWSVEFKFKNEKTQSLLFANKNTGIRAAAEETQEAYVNDIDDGLVAQPPSASPQQMEQMRKQMEEEVRTQMEDQLRELRRERDDARRQAAHLQRVRSESGDGHDED